MKFKVPDMSCGHCTATIEKAVMTADPTATVNCDLDTRRVSIEGALDVDAFSAALKEAGYESESLEA